MILIRADANEQIGTGHIMRCLSIACALIDQGEEVLFATADHCGAKLIKNKGFKAVCLNSQWTEMEKEVSTLLAIIKANKIKLLLVDSYYVTEYYFSTLALYTKLAYIDDLNRSFYVIDYLINYNVYAAIYDYSWFEKTKTKLLLGPMYAPLRGEFKRISPHIIKSNVQEVLVSAGGADPGCVIEKIMSNICPEMKNIVFHFVIGALNPRIDDIKKLADEKGNVVLHINEQHMSNLMKSCDVAISAAGTTLYELCSIGIPTITYTLADNQVVAMEQFKNQNIMLSAGDCRIDDKFIDNIKNRLKELDDIELRKQLSETMQTLVDGNGAERIAKELLSQQ
ncbi:MAG: UDP-2,4-diacetamido-2,4,6-trideoxy-beta-L-altropyranose hydrolase [Eubacteriales bacterium]|nr:UDP-2,4-diacetamido-2,4,6-trideoxy-beta-L-altropyranose hydrolase [Eubacteriales bacterium]